MRKPLLVAAQPNSAACKSLSCSPLAMSRDALHTGKCRERSLAAGRLPFRYHLIYDEGSNDPWGIL